MQITLPKRFLENKRSVGAARVQQCGFAKQNCGLCPQSIVGRKLRDEVFLVPQFYWRRHPDLNRGSGCCRPLPYHLAIAPFFRFCEYATTNHKNEKLSAPAIAGAGTAYSAFTENIPVLPNKLLERITRLELATSTLARWRSTR